MMEKICGKGPGMKQWMCDGW